MTLLESFKKGHRRCKCELELDVRRVEIKQYKRRHRDDLKNMVANSILGKVEKKPLLRYTVCCKKCGKLYFSFSNKTELKKAIKGILNGYIYLQSTQRQSSSNNS